MKIKRMTATFGNLQNATLTPGTGLTVVQAPNETGKSTWCAFLRAMLYGIPTKERDKQGYMAEKNRYRPWSGSPAEGKLELEWNGEAITILRGSKGNTLFGTFQAFYTATGVPVPGMTGENSGEMLLGVPREVFERSAFIGQGAMAVDAAPTLEGRIAALVSTGQEEISYSQVEKQLRDWKNRRRFNRSGLLPALEEELRTLEGGLARQEEVAARLAEADRSATALEEELARLRRERAAQESAVHAAQRAQYEAAEREYRDTAEEATRLRQLAEGIPPEAALRDGQGQLAYLRTVEANLRLAEQHTEEALQAEQAALAAREDSQFPGQKPDEVWEQAVRDEAAAGQQCRSLLPLSILLFVALAAGVVSWLLLLPDTILLLYAAIACGAAGVILLIVALVLRGRARAGKKDILARYGVATVEEILPRVSQYREKWAAAAEATRTRENVQAAHAQLRAEQEDIKRSLLELVRPFEPKVQEMFGVSAAISKALSIGEKLEKSNVALAGAKRLVDSIPAPQSEVEPSGDAAGVAPRFAPDETARRLAQAEQELQAVGRVRAHARGELDQMGAPEQMRARQAQLQADITRREAEYEALRIAMEAMGEANNEMQARFSPALNHLAGAWMERLTGGRYDAVTLDRAFTATAREHGAVLPHESIALSRGTSDQLYLAVRLALCELLLPEDAFVPLILDDALAFFDDERAQLALQVLAQMGATRQILLFTCHGRDSAWALQQHRSSAAAATVNYLQLAER
ncbi:MAG: AAA family ATPase [Oscillospiraceae bacterium]|nr:AAA family ATPase [Oscillospiraceae bacterium]